ncbi:hypothetical protein MP638_005070 [Amoeboaphelidium occidentale]|nr:hypothetical protein MP638_005070 [Amoeboaphelidium occidentale]
MNSERQHKLTSKRNPSTPIKNDQPAPKRANTATEVETTVPIEIPIEDTTDTTPSTPTPERNHPPETTSSGSFSSAVNKGRHSVKFWVPTDYAEDTIDIIKLRIKQLNLNADTFTIKPFSKEEHTWGKDADGLNRDGYRSSVKIYCNSEKFLNDLTSKPITLPVEGGYFNIHMIKPDKTTTLSCFATHYANEEIFTKNVLERIKKVTGSVSSIAAIRIWKLKCLTKSRLEIQFKIREKLEQFRKSSNDQIIILGKKTGKFQDGLEEHKKFVVRKERQKKSLSVQTNPTQSQLPIPERMETDQ